MVEDLKITKEFLDSFSGFELVQFTKRQYKKHLKRKEVFKDFVFCAVEEIKNKKFEVKIFGTGKEQSFVYTKVVKFTREGLRFKDAPIETSDEEETLEEAIQRWQNKRGE